MAPAAKGAPKGKPADDSASKAQELLNAARQEAERIKADAKHAAAQVQADAKQHAETIHADAEKLLADARQEAERLRQGASGGEPDGSTEEYVVVNCGASYKKPGEDPAISRHFALKHNIIELEADEAERLEEADAVVPLASLSDDEVTRLRNLNAAPVEVVVPKEHAEELESKEAHAEKMKAQKGS